MSEPYDPNPAGWPPAAPGYAGPGPPQTYPTQQYPGQPLPAQQFPAQQFPAQQVPAQPYLPYPTQQYPPPQAYAPLGYPAPYGAPGYSLYPDPGAAGRGRPGQVIATAVLGYVEAGWLIMTALVLFTGSSAVSSWSDSGSGDDHGWGLQFALAGLGDIVAAGLLIAGGVVFSSGKRAGRTLAAAGLAVCVGEALFWIIRLSDSSGGVVPWAVFYLVMPIVGTSLSFAGQVSRWLDVVSPKPPATVH
jgi:hypothetical protein